MYRSVLNNIPSEVMTHVIAAITFDLDLYVIIQKRPGLTAVVCIDIRRRRLL